MGKGSKRQYTLEFKQQTAELAKEIGISQVLKPQPVKT